MNGKARNMAGGEEFQADRELIDRCLAGEDAAWSTLYGRYHGLLRGWLLRRLGPARDDVADEVAARVWCALVFEDRRRLKAYDAARSRFGTYLVLLARQELRRYHKEWTCGAAHGRPRPDADRFNGGAGFVPMGLVLHEFLATLSVREKGYFNEHLMNHSGETPFQALSPAYRHKLKQRVRAKFTAFIGGE